MGTSKIFDASQELPVLTQEFLAAQFHDSIYASLAYTLLCLAALAGAYFCYRFDEEYDLSALFIVFAVLFLYAVGAVVIEAKKINQMFTPRFNITYIRQQEPVN